jgi:hypothetical protein
MVEMFADSYEEIAGLDEQVIDDRFAACLPAGRFLRSLHSLTP